MPTLLSTFIALLWLCGCAVTPKPVVSVDSTALVAGDCIVILIPDAGPMFCVLDSSGDIAFPLLHKLHLAGLTLEQTKSLIERELVEKGYYHQFYVSSVSRCRY